MCVSFPCAMTTALGVQLKEGEQLLVLYTCLLGGGAFGIGIGGAEEASKRLGTAGSVDAPPFTNAKGGSHGPEHAGDPPRMTPGSVMVSGVESGDQVAHTDTSTAFHVRPPSERGKSDCHPSTFVALPPSAA